MFAAPGTTLALNIEQCTFQQVGRILGNSVRTPDPASPGRFRLGLAAAMGGLVSFHAKAKQAIVDRAAVGAAVRERYARPPPTNKVPRNLPPVPEMDPELLKQLIKMGPVIKHETKESIAMRSPEQMAERERRKARFLRLRPNPAPGQLDDATLVHALRWRETSKEPPVDAVAKLLNLDEPAATTLASTLLEYYATPHVKLDQHSNLRMGASDRVW
ncbi:hypothetical protein M885DRAFT_608454 [Pelagophyceae sp. CCMP2097]|nr:hypothetical protein M885DRAFT_608454 [Pelagophyceae sp. CCMP2097]